MGESIFIYGLKEHRTRQEKLQRFVNRVVNDGQRRGQAIQLCTLPSDVYRSMRAKGVHLENDHIFISDKAILKYVYHPKAKKGATLPFREFWKIVNIATNPTHIYEDSHQKNLVYTFTSRSARPQHCIKVVVQPNYKHKGRTVCMVTSIGVVWEENMKHPQYKKIR